MSGRNNRREELTNSSGWLAENNFLTRVLFNLSGNILISGQRIQRKPLFSVTVAVWLKLDTNRGQQSIFSTCNPDNPWNSHVQYSLSITDGRVQWLHRNEKSQVIFYGLLGRKLVSQQCLHAYIWSLLKTGSLDNTRVFIGLGFLVYEPLHHALQMW